MKLGKKATEKPIEEQDVKSKNIRWIGRFFKRHKGITVLICVVIVGTLVTVTVLGNRPKAPQAAGSVYTTTALEKRDIATSISVTGTIASAQSRTITSTLSNMEVESLNVQVGDVVTIGDTLVVFDDSQLSEDLSDAKSSLSVSQAQTANSLESAERSYNEASENASIQATRAADNVTSAYNSYTQAVATEASSKTAYQDAKTAEETAQKAYEKQEEKVKSLEDEIAQLQKELAAATEDEQASLQAKITKKQQSLESAQKEYETASAAYKEAQQNTATAKQTYEQAATSLEQANSSYTKAVQDKEDTDRNNKSTLANQESSLENTRLQSTNSSKNEEEQVESIQEQIDSCRITAPISGVVTSLSVDAEETFAGGEVLTIQDNENFVVEASVDEYDIADIEKGMSVVVKTDATSDEELEGEVIYVAPTATSSSGSGSDMAGASSSSSASYQVKISLNTNSDRLRIGMSAKASILTASREDVFAVPYDAIETNEAGESVIYVLDTGAAGSRHGQDTEADSTESAKADNETSDKDSAENTEHTQKGNWSGGEKPEGDFPAMGNGEVPNSRNKEALESDSTTTENKRAIVVEVGLESDYYTEISSDELTEGMVVITGTSSKSADSASNDNMGMMFNGMGSGMSGGGNPGRKGQ